MAVLATVLPACMVAGSGATDATTNATPVGPGWAVAVTGQSREAVAPTGASRIDRATSRGLSINSVGVVVGSSSVEPEGTHAFRYLPRRQSLIDLGTLPRGFRSVAEGVADNGRVVGSSAERITPYWSQVRAFLWRPGAHRMRDLGTLGGENATATAINTRGQIVGSSQTARGRTHAYVWRPTSRTMQDLGTLGGGHSEAAAVNDRAQVVGWSLSRRGQIRAFLWRPKTQTMVNLHALEVGAAEVVALDINDHGQIVGYLYDQQGLKHAFLWRPHTGSMTDLGSLAGDDTTASGINNVGQIVGASRVAGRWRAFLWDPDNKAMVRLRGLGGHTEATAINDRGWVVGTSAKHAVLWRPNLAAVTDLGTLVAPQRRPQPSTVCLTGRPCAPCNHQVRSRSVARYSPRPCAGPRRALEDGQGRVGLVEG
jgi:probable HAF family extracellular repeat protein